MPYIQQEIDPDTTRWIQIDVVRYVKVLLLSGIHRYKKLKPYNSDPSIDLTAVAMAFAETGTGGGAPSLKETVCIIEQHKMAFFVVLVVYTLGVLAALHLLRFMSAARKIDKVVLKFRPHRGANDTLCTICRCEYEVGELVCMLPSCSHSFHPRCIDTWLSHDVSCPNCRSRPLEDPPKAYRHVRLHAACFAWIDIYP
ncbi:hypothetical protein RJ640_025847 [Escallonia rubra]|uniref:RING-type domain-containing protein n=1 Tax=Escallonia rubra TaxID=112253 RepID=A0AA88R3F9_9ASTE|nr:hypothetical protein RJ640_025847 [Escallonia rubra]